MFQSPIDTLRALEPLRYLGRPRNGRRPEKILDFTNLRRGWGDSEFFLKKLRIFTTCRVLEASRGHGEVLRRAVCDLEHETSKNQ